MKRRAILLAVLLGSCATDGTVGVSADFYGGMYYYDDWWYGGGCCVDYPDDIGPPAPRPEHPIALPPGSTPRPEQPIANPPKASNPIATPTATTRSMPSPRPAAPMRGGGGRGGGRR